MFLSSLCSRSGLLSQLLTSDLLLFELLHLDCKLPLLFLLTAESLLLLSLPFGILSLESVFLLFELALSCLLSLLFLQVANQPLSGDLLALVALPDAIWHSFEVCAEQVVGLFT